MKKRSWIILLGNLLVFIGLISAFLMHQYAPFGVAIVGAAVIVLQFMKDSSSRKAIAISVLILIGVSITFLGGYQLAVYQSNQGNNFSLPHFNLGSKSTDYCSQPINNLELSRLPDVACVVD